MARRRFKALRGIRDAVREARAEKAREDEARLQVALARLLACFPDHPHVFSFDYHYQAMRDIKSPDGTVVPRGTMVTRYEVQDEMDRLGPEGRA